MALAWYVGLVEGQQDWTAATSLSDMGYLVYISLRFERVQDGRKVRAEPHLRLQGYIFVALDADPGLGELAAASGAKGMAHPAFLCGAGGKPYVLPEGAVEALRQLERDDFFRARARAKPRPRTDLAPRDMVELNLPGDPFHGKTGEYQGGQRGKAIVLFGAIPKVVRDCDLKKIAPSQKREAA